MNTVAPARLYGIRVSPVTTPLSAQFGLGTSGDVWHTEGDMDDKYVGGTSLEWPDIGVLIGYFVVVLAFGLVVSSVCLAVDTYDISNVPLCIVGLTVATR